METWNPLPNWPFQIPWKEIAEWEAREIPPNSELQKDMLNYIDWAIAFVKHEGRTIEEGHKLYALMTRWKPEDFPLKVSK